MHTINDIFYHNHCLVKLERNTLLKNKNHNVQIIPANADTRFEQQLNSDLLSITMFSSQVALRSLYTKNSTLNLLRFAWRRYPASKRILEFLRNGE